MITKKEVLMQSIVDIESELKKTWTSRKLGLCDILFHNTTYYEITLYHELLFELYEAVPFRYKLLNKFKSNKYYWFGYYPSDIQSRKQWYKPRLKLLYKALKKYK